MRFLERLSAGVVWSLLSLSSQTFHDTQDLLDRMQKHVASDGCVHGLCVDFENRRVHISDTRKLWIVVSVTAAYSHAGCADIPLALSGDSLFLSLYLSVSLSFTPPPPFLSLGTKSVPSSCWSRKASRWYQYIQIHIALLVRCPF